MMSVKSFFRLTSTHLCSLSSRHSAVYRTLFSPAALGVENYLKTRERIKSQFVNVEEKFRSKLLEFVADANSMVFTEDLKHMIHLVEENDEDLALAKQMMIKFSRQNKDLRFGSFVFGPVVMRMYYYLNKPKEALEMFTNPDMDGFFDQLMSFQILMDLLFKNSMYNEVIQVFEIVQKKQVQGSKYPKNGVVLVLAACYKLNSPASLSYTKNLWSELTKVGHYPMRRAGTFAAALAVNQNSPDIALEILGSLKQPTYVTIRNLKVSALTDLNRLDDALAILNNSLLVDSDKKHTFSEEIIEKVKIAIEKIGKKELSQEFEKMEKQFRALNIITQAPLDDQLCSEISAQVTLQAEGRNRFGKNTQRLRPGLQDMC